MLKPSAVSFLKTLLDTPGPSGYEAAAAKVWRDEAGTFAAEVHADVHGNSMAVANPSGSPTIMLAGHIDEIGVIVTYIDDDGYVYIAPIGGWDPQVLVAQRIRFIGRDGHVLGAVGLLVLLCLQVVWGAGVTAPKRPLSAGLWRLSVWTFTLLIVQVALGGWVSANYAVLACNDFPTCQGRWWPQMDFAQGFELWRALGLTAAGEHISFAALTAIHYTHRLAAYVVLTLLIALAWQLNRVKDCRTQSRVLAALIGLQLATGLSNVVMGWPLIAALLHTGGAGALVLTLTWTLARMHPPAVPGKGPVPGRLNAGRLA